MINRHKILLIICNLFCSLILSSCGGNKTLVFTPTPFSYQHPSETTSSVPSMTVTQIASPDLGIETFIITPEDLSSIHGIKPFNTPNAPDFCKNLPTPQVIRIDDTNRMFTLRGRFVLCPSISWPLVNTAMDLDNGKLVAIDDTSGDIAIDYTHPGLDGMASYFVYGLNNAHIDEIDTNAINHKFCETVLLTLNKNDPGVLLVDDGEIACVLTTGSQIAVIRVENIYPADIQGVEFSFAILKKE